METQKTAQTSVEIPDFDFAKVGKKRERKGGAFLWLSGGGVKGFAGRLLSEIVSNIGVFALVGTVGAGAWGYGKAMAPEYEKFQAEQKAGTAPKKTAKQKPQYEGDLSNLAGPRKTREDSVGMISGSLDGKTPEERAAEASAAAKKAKEEAEAQAKADAAAEEPMADVPGVDPNAVAAAEGEVSQNNNAPTSKGMAQKYGALSTSLGGSSRLAGGAGMSGGSGKGFDTPKFKTDKGKLLAMRSAGSGVGRAKSGSVASFRSNSRSLARRQADKARHFSNLARKGNNETRSSLASTAFDNNKPGGEYVTGAGDGAGGNGGQGADGSPAPNQPSGGGGAVGDMGNVDAPAPVANVAGRSVDPTDGIIKILKMLTMMIAMLAMIQTVKTILLAWEKGMAAAAAATVVGGSAAAAWTAKALSTWIGKNMIMASIIALGLVVAGLGIALMAMGRVVGGAIYTVIGLGTSAFAFFGNPAAHMITYGLLVGGANAVMPFMDTGRKYDQGSGKWTGG